VIQDADGILRRQILAVGSPSPCQNEYSLNWWLATQYLAAEGIKGTSPKDYLQLGTVPLKRIQAHTGGYHDIDAKGHQILINYRATDQIAETITLQELLNGQFDISRVRDRIVLIGVVAPTFNDHDWFTPYSGGHNPSRMTGVEVQAHMTSQLISAVLDHRPLLWSWPEAVEILWIGAWTVSASLIGVRMRSPSSLTLALSTMVIGLSGSCWILICYGGWIPFIPAFMGMVGAAVGVATVRRKD
jgi:CHASE2 domain-containing sensor protein